MIQTRILSVALAFLLASFMPIWAQDSRLEALSERVEAGRDAGAAAQVRIEALDDEIDAATRAYRAETEKLAALRAYNAQLAELIAAQKNDIAARRRQIDEVVHIDRRIVPLMADMVDALEAFVALDTPFLPSERRARVAALRALMARADADPAEKYRRIIAAYEIENEYGRTIEAYEDDLDIDGEMRRVVFLRIGRVALIYQTPDGGESGIWRNAEKRFVPLDGDFDSELRMALRIARQQAAPDLMVVPLVAGE